MDIKKTRFKNELKYPDLLNPILEILKNNPTSEDELVNFLSDDKRYKEFDKDTIINPEVKDALYFLHRINYVKNNNGQLKITDKYLNDIEEFHKKDKTNSKDFKEHIINKINKKLDIPKGNDYYQEKVLKFLKKHPNNTLKRKDMILKIISEEKYPKEMLKILTRGKSPSKNNKYISKNKNIVIFSRYDYAISNLKTNKLINNTKNSPFNITQEGLDYINNLDENSTTKKENIENKNKTKDIQETIQEKLLNKLKSYSPKFFEKIVLDVLMKKSFMGIKPYDGYITDYVHDKGIDGVIYLGPNKTYPKYFQAKRWKKNIQRQHIEQFIGALFHKSPENGIFVTTSDFSPKAKELAKEVEMILINGKELVDLMIENKIGIKTVIDEDYFIEKRNKI